MKPAPHRALLFATALVFGANASAHTVINERTVEPGNQNLTLRVTHACPGSVTKALRVQIPAGVTRVHPFYVPGWEIETKKRKLDKPIRTEEGFLVTETAEQVTWSGGRIPDGVFAEFRLKVTVPDTPGRTLYFKIVQVCEQGELRWIDTPAQGEKDFDYQDPDNPVLKYKAPAAFTKIVAAK